MTPPSTTDPPFARDVEHELRQAIELSSIVRNRSVRRLPPVLQSAVHTAFAAHFRALMEFFHDGTPSAFDWKRLPSEARNNVRYSQITGTGSNPYSRRWSKADLRRFRDAHKLVGHLAEERSTRRRMRKEWGADADWRLLKSKIQHFLKSPGTHIRAYAHLRAQAKRVGLHLRTLSQPLVRS
jgi:hypothetical protein